MKLSIVTAVCGAIDITEQFMHHTVGRCAVRPELIVVSNGNTPKEEAKLQELLDEFTARWAHGGEFRLISLPEPVGSTKAFNAGVALATGDVVALLHNDLLVREGDWDQKVLGFFEANPQTGVCGFHGAQALGSDKLYTAAYDMRQLARTDNYSNLEDAEDHGYRRGTPMEVVTLDGMSLITRLQVFREIGGLEEKYPHHMYDHDLCLTARSQGYTNYMLPISAKHVSGQTANATRYNDHLKEIGLGADADVHRQAHVDFYEKWKGTGQLPARVKRTS